MIDPADLTPQQWYQLEKARRADRDAASRARLRSIVEDAAARETETLDTHGLKRRRGKMPAIAVGRKLRG